jgi:lipopolysaccharide export system permease protein
MVGGFSRFGVTRQIVFAIFLLVVIKVVESAVTDSVRKDAGLWFLVYLPTGVGLGMVVMLLWQAARPFRRRRRREVAA